MKIILSCTTTQNRIGIFYYCLQSILKQSLKPDLILVNISKEPYLEDKGFTRVPEWLKKEKVTINVVDNTGPYRKLLPALEYAHKEDFIITADDDIIYAETWLKDLITASQKVPNCITCARGRRMKKNPFNNWRNYGDWHLVIEPIRGMNILPTGGAGVIYNKKLLNVEFLTDKKFLDIAPTTDDLWFRMASLLKKTEVAVYPRIQQKNRFIEHDQGLIYMNSQKEGSNGLLSKGFQRIRNNLLDFCGINRTANDMAWDNIVAYAKNEYEYKE